MKHRTTPKKEVQREFPDAIDEVAERHGLDAGSRRRLRAACSDLAAAYDQSPEWAEQIIVRAVSDAKA